MKILTELRVRMVSHQWRRFAFFSKEIVKDDNGDKWAGLQVRLEILSLST